MFVFKKQTYTLAYKHTQQIAGLTAFKKNVFVNCG